MKKILTLIVVVVIALGSAGYVKGYVPNTPPYKEKVRHENIMDSLKKMDEATRSINSHFLRDYMTKDRAIKMQDEVNNICYEADKKNEDDAQGKALSGMCVALLGEFIMIESASSNNGSEDINPQQIALIQQMSKDGTDPAVDQFLRDADDEEAIKFVEKKFKNFSNRYN